MLVLMSTLPTKRRTKWMEGKKCANCGSISDLVLDHIDPATKTISTTGQIWGWSRKRLEAELALCQVLCKPCHDAKTGTELRKPIRHGDAHAYKKHRCRCDACRAWASAYWQRYKASHLNAA